MFKGITRGRNQAQTKGTEKLWFFSHFKGTTSREEHKTGFSAFTTFESKHRFQRWLDGVKPNCDIHVHA